MKMYLEITDGVYEKVNVCTANGNRDIVVESLETDEIADEVLQSYEFTFNYNSITLIGYKKIDKHDFKMMRFNLYTTKPKNKKVKNG